MAMNTTTIEAGHPLLNATPPALRRNDSKTTVAMKL